MKNGKIILTALLSITLLCSSILPAWVVGASTVMPLLDDHLGSYSIGESEYAPRIAAGGGHTVGLKSDGTVVAVGYNNNGQCNIGGWTDINQVVASSGYTVGLKSNGTVVAVGSNSYGQCDIGGWTGIIRVAAGWRHTVGLKSDGTAVAVGHNNGGQCDVGGWTDIIQVVAGGGHSVGLKFNGSVVAMGWNNYGQCNVGSWTDIIQAAAGSDHTVGLKSDGTVVAVGWNDNGQCEVGGWTNIIQVAADAAHTVGLRSDGTAVATGSNNDGQCDVGGWTDIIQVAAGWHHTVGFKSDGTVVAVGSNSYGQCDVDSWDLDSTSDDPDLCVSTNSLDFGTTSASKTFTIQNCGGGTLTWSITDNQPWLGVSPTSGSTTTETETITVTVDRTGYDPGSSHSGTITVSSNGGTEYISVYMQVPDDDPDLCVSTNSLDFGTTSTSKTFTIQNCGGGTLTWSITDNQPWLGVSPTSGSTTTETETITVTVDRTGYDPGSSHSGTITVSSNGGTEYISVYMQVPDDDPDLCVSTNSLDFGTTSTSKTLTIENCGGGTLTWSISDNQPWLGVSPTSGSTTTETETITVTVDRTGYDPGSSHSGTITVTSNGGTEYISVYMQVPDDDPDLCVSTNSLDFGTTDTSRTFTIQNCGGGTLTWEISDNQHWLRVSADDGSTTTETETITVTVDRTGYPPGSSQSGTITVSSNGGTEYISVSMQVPDDDPELCIPTNSLNFGTVSTSKTLAIENCGGGTLTWDISDNRPWLGVSPTSGSTTTETDTFTVTVDRTGYAPGSSQSGTITVSSNSGTEYISVSMQVPCVPAEKDIVVVVEGLDFDEFWDDIDDVAGELEQYVPDLFPGFVDLSDVLAVLHGFDLEFEFEDNDYLSNELASTSWEVSHFEWNRDPSFTDQHVDALKDFLETEHARAQCSDKKFIVISHSWGTILTHAALSKLAEEGSPVLADLYITLSSPLGTYWALDWYDPVINPVTFATDAVVALYVLYWSDSLNLDTAPSVGRWVNYWAWGDFFSGPVGSQFSWVEDRQIDPPNQLLGALTRGPLNIPNLFYWHKYTSLDYGQDDNKGLKAKVRSIIWNTIVGNYVSSEYTADSLHIILHCPVDMIVTDPDGLTISSDRNEIPGAVYIQTDLDEDGDPDDQVIIPHGKEGDYEITVAPEPGAMPTDTYSLTASRGDSTIVLVEDSAVADIPDDPYILTVTLPGEGLNTTVIIIASVSAVVVIVILAFFLRRKRRAKQTQQEIVQ